MRMVSAACTACGQRWEGWPVGLRCTCGAAHPEMPTRPREEAACPRVRRDFEARPRKRRAWITLLALLALDFAAWNVHYSLSMWMYGRPPITPGTSVVGIAALWLVLFGRDRG